ncbi:MAG TPA: exodeoxyribonuclease V subunit gamma [Ignavibacteriales bacterium]|nr:exodeoxyribonuclease V subunit gamma [Ignavibacteriales bacterium]HOL80745.1 exodeoxyribonuclease V subunit gamma [Ignavibacteriales bacterium]HOM65992.1 exodeoxyribonuclease V subunit gamma [Ignavibacteriales bacterium]HPD67775.1 exodeoxyribonuclease V subunit gamma [Ignavibacteriales bacterium]HPP33181.1 exodeoxyribonuclease V subunit gamma [Ignavibacteriales bacterium]
MSCEIKISISQEHLLDDLCNTISQNLNNPFTKQTIVTQSSGMSRWLSLNISQKLGISSNIMHFFPYKLILELFHLTHKNELDYAYDINSLSLVIYHILKNTDFVKQHTVLEKYINSIKSNDANIIKFSFQLAHLYEKYIQYRPSWISSWNNNQLLKLKNDEFKHQKWQKNLWNSIKTIVAKPDLVEIFEQIIQKLKSIEIPENHHLKNIHFFGINHLPPFYFNLLISLQNIENINTYFYYQTPSIEYYADQNKTTSLLGSFAKIGKDFFDLLNINFNLNYDEKSLGIVEELSCQEKLLSYIKTDLLKCVERKIDMPLFQNADDAKTIKEDDLSLEILSTYNHLREIEVVYDKILHILNNDPDCKPDNILVMAPDINDYADYIDAVFANDIYRISYTVADKSILAENKIYSLFLKLLSIKESRFTVNDIYDLIKNDFIKDNFNINENDLTFIDHLITQTKTKWGLDGSFKSNFNLPTYEENTWLHTFSQMFLGYSISSDLCGNDIIFNTGNSTELYKNTYIYPFDDTEGECVNSYSKLLTFFEKLSSLYHKLNKSYTLEKWIEIINQIIIDFFPPQTHDLLSKLVHDLNKIHIQNKNIFNNNEFSTYCINSFIENILQKTSSTNRFLQNGITFCSLIPMRSIPFKYIFLIGMNIDKFPKESTIPEFDLIKLNPQIADKTQSDDDKYIFLETLLAAKEKIFISYQGRDEITNEKRQISTTVDELINYINTYYILPDGINDIRNLILKEYPLQGFSKKYFAQDSELFTYHKKYYEIAKAISLNNNQSKLKSLTTPYEIQDDEITVNLNDLIRFFINPVRYFYNKSLQIHLPYYKEITIDEQLEPDNRYKTNLRNEIFSHFIDMIINKNANDLIIQDKFFDECNKIYQKLKAQSNIINGYLGWSNFYDICKNINDFFQQTHELFNSFKPNVYHNTFLVDNKKITIELDTPFIHQKMFFHFLTNDIRNKTRYKIERNLYGIFLRTLGLTISKPIIITAKSSFSRNTTDNYLEKYQSTDLYPSLTKEIATILFNDILKLYLKGLQNPLIFFPESSYEFVNAAQQKLKDKITIFDTSSNKLTSIYHNTEISFSPDDYQDELNKADNKFFNDYPTPEYKNEYFNYFFSDFDFYTSSDFIKNSITFFLPYLSLVVEKKQS